MIGIYGIKIEGKYYVGQSTNIRKRWNDHLRNLEKGKHHSHKLQEAYNEYGFESVELHTLEICEKHDLDEKEKKWMAIHNSIDDGYNVANPDVSSYRKVFKQLLWRKKMDISFNVFCVISFIFVLFCSITQEIYLNAYFRFGE